MTMMMDAPAQIDPIVNGAASGHLGSTLLMNDFDMKPFRPWRGEDGHTYVNVRNSKGIVEPRRTQNTAGLLRPQDWKAMDESIIKVAKSRLKVVSEIRSRGLVYTIPNGMGKTMFQTEVQSDVNEATISMDGLRQSIADRPTFDIKHLPMPIVHKDFFISARQLAASRSGGSPFDTTMGELAARRVAEVVEQLTTGTYGTFTFGGGTIYGLANYTYRNTHTITSPAVTAWTPLTTVTDVLAMRQKAYNDNFFGPFMLYHSLDWDPYMDRDYVASGGNNPNQTLRERLKKIDGIAGVQSLDYLGTTGSYILMMVQMTSDVIRMVVGQDFTTIQWETQGGMQINFKVLCIIVPHIRSDAADQCGIVHGAPA